MELVTIKVKTYKDIPKNYTGIVEYPNREKRWFINGKYHKTDGPAVEHPDGEKRWFLNGKRHRTDGPAVEYPNRTKLWYLNDKLHRTDGPAYEYANGEKRWFLNGKKYTREEHFQYVAEHHPESIRRLIWNL